MRKFIFSSLLCICMSGIITIVNAQDYKTYNLNSYYTPDIVRNYLDLNGLLSQESDLGHYQSTSKINGNVYGSYYHLVNTRKKICELRSGISLSGGGNTMKRFYEKIISKNNSFSNGDFINIRYKFYNNSKYFLSTDTHINYYYDSNSNNNTDSLLRRDYSSSSQHNILGGLSVGIGKGRIEHITDAVQTVYLIEALQNKGLLKKDFDDNDIFDLSQKISTIKNKRFLDSPQKLIEEITKVDSFIVSNNKINKQDAAYFTTLYDIWLNGANFERKTGRIIELKIQPNIYFKNQFTTNVSQINNQNDYTEQYKISDRNYRLGIYYLNEKSINYKWQKSFNAQAEAAISNNYQLTDKSTSTKTTNESLYKTANSNVSYRLGYYPNTRTNIYGQLSNRTDLNYYSQINNNNSETISTAKDVYNISEIAIGTYYYFSPNLRLSANATVRNYFNIYDITANISANNRFTNNLTLSITYLVF